MNERIKELKDQCWVEKHWDNGMWVEKHIDQEKFAELIVRECIANVKDWEKDSRNHISYMLERHFGVEE